MIQNFSTIKVQTIGQNLYELTSDIIKWIEINKLKNGIINVSIQHTSASLIIQENADPAVKKDLLNFFNKLAPMDSSRYAHSTEGKDDMPAHIKSSITNNQISISVKNGQMLLGTWQGVYLFEHRLNLQNRTVILHYLGD